MKRVAIIGPDFLPSTLPPALRIRFFAQHLPAFGWEPTVITTDPAFYEGAVDPRDEELMPPGLRVVRTRALPARWTRKLGLGDLGFRSLLHHWRALRRLHRQRPFDLVFAPTPPVSPLLLAGLARGRLGIPFVVDYIDPPATDYYWKLPRSQRPPKWIFSYWLGRAIESFALKRASGTVGVDGAYFNDAKRRYAWFAGARPDSIPYGGDPADLDHLRAHPRRNLAFDPADGLLHVSYVGRAGVDINPTLRVVFRAVHLGLERRPELFSRLRLHFVGTTYAYQGQGQYQVLPRARELGVERVVDEKPQRVPYLDALQVLLDSHALLVVGSEAPQYTASKIFPYILARRPLLAVFNQASSVVRILRETAAGAAVTFTSREDLPEKTEAVYGELQRLLELPPGSEPPTDWAAFEPYTTRSMTARLAAVFDHAVSAGTSPRG